MLLGTLVLNFLNVLLYFAADIFTLLNDYNYYYYHHVEYYCCCTVFLLLHSSKMLRLEEKGQNVISFNSLAVGAAYSNNWEILMKFA